MPDRLFLSRSAAASAARAGLLVAPADGKVVEITPLEHDEFVGGPAVRIAIFLSLFNVHVNRAPCAARVIRLRYSPGRFISALEPGLRDPQRKHVDRPGRGIRRRIAVSPCGRSPARWRGGSFAICGRAKSSAGAKSSA